jgi:hypothetical protein
MLPLLVIVALHKSMLGNCITGPGAFPLQEATNSIGKVGAKDDKEAKKDAGEGSRDVGGEQRRTQEF